MVKFKIGDKVRATDVYVEESRNWAEDFGIPLDETGSRIAMGETLVVVRIDPEDSDLPWPIGAQFVEGEPWHAEEGISFDPEELEHVED